MLVLNWPRLCPIECESFTGGVVSGPSLHGRGVTSMVGFCQPEAANQLSFGWNQLHQAVTYRKTCLFWEPLIRQPLIQQPLIRQPLIRQPLGDKFCVIILGGCRIIQCKEHNILGNGNSKNRITQWNRLHRCQIRHDCQQRDFLNLPVCNELSHKNIQAQFL